MICLRCGNKMVRSKLALVWQITALIMAWIFISCCGYFLIIQNADRRKYIADSEKDRQEVMKVIEDFKKYGKQNWVHQELGKPIKKGGK